MRFRKKYSKITVMMAVIHGIGLGVIAVVLVGLLLFLTEGQGKESNTATDSAIPTAGPQETGKENQKEASPALTLYAVQHGVFSSMEAATNFLVDQSELEQAAVVAADQQYFVWSAVGLTEEEVAKSKNNTPSFLKTFQVQQMSCSSEGANQLFQMMKLTDLTKIKSSMLSKKKDADVQPLTDFDKKLLAITTFTEDPLLFRLHLIAHYTVKEDCLKISF